MHGLHITIPKLYQYRAIKQQTCSNEHRENKTSSTKATRFRLSTNTTHAGEIPLVDICVLPKHPSSQILDGCSKNNSTVCLRHEHNEWSK